MDFHFSLFVFVAEYLQLSQSVFGNNIFSKEIIAVANNNQESNIIINQNKDLFWDKAIFLRHRSDIGINISDKKNFVIVIFIFVVFGGCH